MGFFKNVTKAVTKYTPPGMLANLGYKTATGQNLYDIGSGGGGGGQGPTYGGESVSNVDPAAINNYFQQYLGRAATQDEISYLKEYLDKGHLTTFEAGQIISGLPEAQQRQFSGYADQYKQQLAGQDEAILNRAGNQLQSRFAQQGRPDTSSYGAAYLSAAKDLAIARQPAIAQFYGQGYANLQQQPYQASQQAQGRGYQLEDRAYNRQNDISDYYRQQNDYNDRLNSYNRSGRWDQFANTGIQGLFGVAGGFAGGFGSQYGKKYYGG